jgi:hypothetical protein
LRKSIARDHAVGVGQGGGDRLLAQDALDAGLGGVDHDLGVAVVGRSDAEQVDALALQQFTVVGVGPGGRPRRLVRRPEPVE